MLIVENFDKNAEYTNEQINELCNTIDTWSDDFIRSIYKGGTTNPENARNNLIRIHKHIDKLRVVRILKETFWSMT